MAEDCLPLGTVFVLLWLIFLSLWLVCMHRDFLKYWTHAVAYLVHTYLESYSQSRLRFEFKSMYLFVYYDVYISVEFHDDDVE